MLSGLDVSRFQYDPPKHSPIPGVLLDIRRLCLAIYRHPIAPFVRRRSNRERNPRSPGEQPWQMDRTRPWWDKKSGDAGASPDPVSLDHARASTWDPASLSASPLAPAPPTPSLSLAPAVLACRACAGTGLRPSCAPMASCAKTSGWTRCSAHW